MIRAFRLRTLTFMLALLTASPAFLAAQDPAAASVKKILIGDPSVDGSFLKPYKNAWKVVYAFPGKEPFVVGTWSDELTTVEINGRHLLKRTQMADYAKYHVVSTYINIFDPKTMAPVSMDFKRSDTGEWAHRDFEKSVVRIHRGDSAEQSKSAELHVEPPVFDYNGGMFGVLLAALPLDAGLKATFPTLSEDRDELQWATITVGKPELMDAGPGKQVMAWPVDTEADYANKSHSIFWITKEPPYVIKLVTIIPEGKWVTVTMSMI